MKIGIHQAHFWPWPGYLDKMLKCDKFIILDEVQLELGSPMVRNELLDNQGEKKFINVNFIKKGFLEKKNNEILVFNGENWQKKQNCFIFFNYKKCPFFDEIYPLIEPIYSKNYEFLIELECDTIEIMRKCFDLKCEIIMQSELSYERTVSKNEMLIELCKSVGADIYLSGNGAKKYMNLELFRDAGINVQYQKFSYPIYTQKNSANFVPNLSALDMLFNCGIDNSRKILRNNSQGDENAIY